MRDRAAIGRLSDMLSVPPNLRWLFWLAAHALYDHSSLWVSCAEFYCIFCVSICTVQPSAAVKILTLCGSFQARPNFLKNAMSDLRFLILTLSSILAWTFNEWSAPGRKKIGCKTKFNVVSVLKHYFIWFWILTFFYQELTIHCRFSQEWRIKSGLKALNHS